MAKMSITFKGFDILSAELDRAGKDLKPAVNEALEKTQKYVQENLEMAVLPYAQRSTKPEIGKKYSWVKGDLYQGVIREPKIEWTGTVATVGVGFTTDRNWRGFMHSIFVMYGVPAHGKFNRGYQKDANVYNAIRGVRTKNQIAKLQKEIMQKHLKLGR